MITTSQEFDKAIEAELERLVSERIKGYSETEEFYSRLDAVIQNAFKSMFNSFSTSTGQLSLHLCPPLEGAAPLVINLEDALDDEFKDAEEESVELILRRLEIMTGKARTRLEALRCTGSHTS